MADGDRPAHDRARPGLDDRPSKRIQSSDLTDASSWRSNLPPPPTRGPRTRGRTGHRGLLRTSVDRTGAAAGAGHVCVESARLFGADRATVWMHDRGTRMLGAWRRPIPRTSGRRLPVRPTIRSRRRPWRCAVSDGPGQRPATPRRSWWRCRCTGAGARSALWCSKACASSPAVISIFSTAPTNSGGSCRERSKTCSCSIDMVRRGVTWAGCRWLIVARRRNSSARWCSPRSSRRSASSSPASPTN